MNKKEQNSISSAWICALDNALSRSNCDATPLVVSINSFCEDGLPVQNFDLKSDIDDLLIKQGKITTDDCAFVIFPYSLWELFDFPGIPEFTELCKRQLLNRLRKLHHKNRHGTYFERMIQYSGVKRGEKEPEKCDQLAFIHKIWYREKARNKRPRQSALQIACFDPVKDHTGSCLSGFPCLQQVSLAYGDDDSLVLNAYYPTQYLFDRAYGNYLGLCHLGLFISRGLGTTLRQVNCFIGKPEIGKLQEGQRKEIRDLLKKYKS